MGAHQDRGGALAGRHAVVTGGGRGIGAAIAASLAREGAAVTIVGRDPARLEQAARAVGATPIALDVTVQAAVEEAFAAVTRANGPVSILVNNAGAARSAPFGRTDLALWNGMLEANLTGTFLCSRAALPPMREAGWGRIINIASTAALTGYAYVTAYCAAKHAVLGLTRALAVELARTGVTVNAVCPGYTDTDLVTGAVATIVERTGRSREEAVSELVARNPQGRLVRPEEVAAAVTWLCLPGSDAVTGQAIAVCGGETM